MFKDLPWAYMYVIDQDGQDTGFAVVRGPLRGERLDWFEKIAADHRMIGMTSYAAFPMMVPGFEVMPPGASDMEDGRDRPYVKALEGWLHCFRDPDAWLPAGKPRELLSESDFRDPDGIWFMGTSDEVPGKDWDVAYLADPALRKNWDVGRRCVIRMCQAGLRVLVVAPPLDPEPPEHPLLTRTGRMGWAQLLNHTARSRVTIFCSVYDPSPRYLTESLCLDVPVLVNSQIVGGWKYVNERTGRFFTGDDDVIEEFMTLVDQPTDPREWFRQHYGPESAGRRLADFLNRLGDGPHAESRPLASARFHCESDKPDSHLNMLRHAETYRRLVRPRTAPT